MYDDELDAIYPNSSLLNFDKFACAPLTANQRARDYFFLDLKSFYLIYYFILIIYIILHTCFLSKVSIFTVNSAFNFRKRGCIMARKKRTAQQKEVQDYRHDTATRKNNPPAGIAAQGKIQETPKQEYVYNPTPAAQPSIRSKRRCGQTP